MKSKAPAKDNHLDRLQERLGIKLRRTDAFDFCYWHFWELMEFTMLLSDDIVRCDVHGKHQPINYQDKRSLVKLCRAYDDLTETVSVQKSKIKWTPRVPISHCLKSLTRAFDKHFDDLLHITHEEEKISHRKI